MCASDKVLVDAHCGCIPTNLKGKGHTKIEDNGSLLQPFGSEYSLDDISEVP